VEFNSWDKSGQALQELKSLSSIQNHYMEFWLNFALALKAKLTKLSRTYHIPFEILFYDKWLEFEHGFI